jgi:hypothetical protein
MVSGNTEAYGFKTHSQQIHQLLESQWTASLCDVDLPQVSPAEAMLRHSRLAAACLPIAQG